MSCSAVQRSAVVAAGSDSKVPADSVNHVGDSSIYSTSRRVKKRAARAVNKSWTAAAHEQEKRTLGRRVSKNDTVSRSVLGDCVVRNTRSFDAGGCVVECVSDQWSRRGRNRNLTVVRWRVTDLLLLSSRPFFTIFISSLLFSLSLVGLGSSGKKATDHSSRSPGGREREAEKNEQWQRKSTDQCGPNTGPTNWTSCLDQSMTLNGGFAFVYTKRCWHCRAFGLAPRSTSLVFHRRAWMGLVV